MNKQFSELAIKAGKAVIKIISAQLINYISSEEFTKRIKQFTQDIVSVLVNLVLSEKNALGEKNSDRKTQAS